MMRNFVLVAVAVACCAQVSDASVLGSFLRKGTFATPIQSTIEDSNAEYIVKGAGNTDLTRFEIGDSVELYLDFETYASSSDGFFTNTPLDNAAAGGSGYKFYGQGALTITDITDIAGGVGTFQFEGEIDFFERTDGADLFGGPPATISAADATIAGATKIFTLGTVGDDFITAVGAPIAFADIPTTGDAVDADFGLSLIDGGEDLNLVPNALEGELDGVDTGTFHTAVGSVQTFSSLFVGSVLGDGDDRFDLRTNTNLTIVAAVPEPSTFAIWAALGACAVLPGRRRSRRA